MIYALPYDLEEMKSIQWFQYDQQNTDNHFKFHIFNTIHIFQWNTKHNVCPDMSDVNIASIRGPFLFLT